MKTTHLVHPGVVRRVVLGAGLSAALLVALSVVGCGVRRESPVPLADVPADLQVAGPQVAVVHATGFQVYTCVADASGALAWTLKAPDARFENNSGLKGTHYAGPTWGAADGSKVVGHKLKEHASPSGDAIAWLLLEGASHEGSGTLAQVTFIQRIHTVGGKAPAVGNSKAGDEVRVAYSADYVFYGPGATTGGAR